MMMRKMSILWLPFTVLLLFCFVEVENKRRNWDDWKIPTTGCVFGNVIYKPGQKWSAPGKCAQFTCQSANTISVEPCATSVPQGVVGIDCREIPGNPSSPFPGCCPKLNCIIDPYQSDRQGQGQWPVQPNPPFPGPPPYPPGPYPGIPPYPTLPFPDISPNPPGPYPGIPPNPPGPFPGVPGYPPGYWEHGPQLDDAPEYQTDDGVGVKAALPRRHYN